MRGIEFEGSRIIGAGGNPNTNDLHVRIYTDPNIEAMIAKENEGKPPEEQKLAPVFVVSCHVMDEEERAAFAQTGKIWLCVMAHPHYPTMSPALITPFHPEHGLGYIPTNPINKQGESTTHDDGKAAE